VPEVCKRNMVHSFGERAEFLNIIVKLAKNGNQPLFQNVFHSEHMVKNNVINENCLK
jgi:hypothetical protein